MIKKHKIKEALTTEIRVSSVRKEKKTLSDQNKVKKNKKGKATK